jgi:protein gp37
MSQPSSIEWTEYTWNPVTGCTKISTGCANCYAERMANRLRAMGAKRYRDGFELKTHDDLLAAPLTWRSPRVVFVNSMSDLFHEAVPTDFIQCVFETMNKCPQHTFQVLTKRAERLEELSSSLSWTHNIWMGVTVEDASAVSRTNGLLASGARVKFLSCEPLLGPLDSLSLEGLDWVIVGGESGPRSRPMQPEWATSVRDMCELAGVPYFFK